MRVLASAVTGRYLGSGIMRRGGDTDEFYRVVRSESLSAKILQEQGTKKIIKEKKRSKRAKKCKRGKKIHKRETKK